MELPKRLENRFSLYLNILPMLEKAGLYGSLTLGLLLSIIAVTQVALRASRSIASQQQYNRNLMNNSVYNACEEKLTSKCNAAAIECKKQKCGDYDDDRGNKSSDEDDEEHECLNIIRRADADRSIQYELENDDALSDIDYNEINDEEEEEDESSSTNSSSEQVC